MKNTFKRMLAGMAIAAGSLTAAAWTSEKYQIENMSVEVEHGLVKVRMRVEPKGYRLSLNRTMTVAPVLKSVESNDSIVLPSFRIAGRNAYYAAVREGKEENLMRSGAGDTLDYAAMAEWEPWMEHSRLELQAVSTGCCGVPTGRDAETPVAEIDFRPIEFVPQFHYIVPKAEAVKKRHIEGMAYVNFPVNRTEIYPDYMVNPQELKKITNSIDSVKFNPDATVKSITLTGFASPEGPYKNNVRLAKGRTEAVKEYVRGQYTFPAEVFHTNSVPEDWAGLRDSIAHCILADRQQMLDFIDNGGVKIEVRNDEFRRRFPQSYEFLLKHVYPSLRHTNYAIDYEIKTYANIEEIRKALAERPGNLSLNEFYLAANSYPEGSEERASAFATAVLYHPTDTIANINAANSAMNEGDLKRARVLLKRVAGDATADYALAVLDALEGNYEEARKGFETAEKAGIPEATEALKQIALLQERKMTIRYYPDQK